MVNCRYGRYAPHTAYTLRLHPVRDAAVLIDVSRLRMRVLSGKSAVDQCTARTRGPCLRLSRLARGLPGPRLPPLPVFFGRRDGTGRGEVTRGHRVTANQWEGPSDPSHRMASLVVARRGKESWDSNAY